MQGELVRTTTPDHVRLHGFYTASKRPPHTRADIGGCDAAVLLHGLGSNFYSSRLLLRAAQALNSLGISTLIANTRGHDMINTSNWAGRARSIGAALERVGDATEDVAGWVDFLRRRDHPQVLLFGHSLGAIKSLYAQAHRPLDPVRALIGLSATRLSHDQLLRSPRGTEFEATLEHCRQQVAAGAGDLPIQVPFPFPTWMTPACYLDKYGPGETYDWLRFADRIDVPTLLIFGQRELDENPAFAGLRPELEAVVRRSRVIETVEIEGADHFYSGHLGAVEDQLVRWLTTRPPAPC